MRLFARLFVVGLLAGLFLFPAWTDALAQISWEVGLKAGVSGATLTGNDVSEYGYYIDPDNYFAADVGDLKTGFVGGGYATVHLNKRWGVRLEALYFQKGGQGDGSGMNDGNDFAAKATVKLDYFEVPVLAVFSLPAGSSGTFDIFAGAAVAFNAAAKSKIEGANLAGDVGSQEEDIEDVANTEYGGVVGLGYTWVKPKMNIFIDGRWEFGFTEVVDIEDVNIKNSAFALMVGVGFPLGGSGGGAAQ